MRNFQQLAIWQKSHNLTLKIYTLTRSFPKDEIFGLISQMRRSSSSIPTNIAEGCGRNSNTELKRFLVIAAGSASELQYQFQLSKDLQYITQPLFQQLDNEISSIRKMIYRFHAKIES
ncbi:MAG: four helix bundle protein [Chitinophagaceae bacterium]